MLVLARCGVLMLALIAIGGCAKPVTPPASDAEQSAAHAHEHEDHQDHGDEPESLAAALEELRESKAALDKCFEDKDVAKADNIVHEIGHTLEHIAEFVKHLPENEQSEMQKPLDALFEKLGKLDDDIHTGQEIKYDEVSQPIDEDISALQEHATH